MKIGESLKKARIDAGITQAELARRLDVTPQTVSQYERGLINPKIETLRKFADALGVNVDTLCGENLRLGMYVLDALNDKSFTPDMMETAQNMAQSVSRLVKTYTESDEEQLILSYVRQLQNADKDKVLSYCQWLVASAQQAAENAQDAAGDAPKDTDHKND